MKAFAHALAAAKPTVDDNHLTPAEKLQTWTVNVPGLGDQVDRFQEHYNERYIASIQENTKRIDSTNLIRNTCTLNARKNHLLPTCYTKENVGMPHFYASLMFPEETSSSSHFAQHYSASSSDSQKSSSTGFACFTRNTASASSSQKVEAGVVVQFNDKDAFRVEDRCVFCNHLSGDPRPISNETIVAYQGKDISQTKLAELFAQDSIKKNSNERS
eukprot:TRINITY_DN4913_c0_g1_i1.p1 TRINITY_DN4913_c0_g1~~TRINITY_DN4913_c0_g1_i1.p1  ORF type:complete len:216 (-),score=27.18 TRINITY_DN4913_c0_g1_i1:104-751(-)